MGDPERLPEDTEPFPALGPADVELSDADLDRQAQAKQAATEALEDGKTEEAINKYTEAITIGNASALMYAKRAELLLKMKRPLACINDSGAALKLNPDSAKALKTRGKAYRKLCKWEESFSDLSTGQKLDFDDATADVLDIVSKKWKVINEKRVRKRLKQEEKDKKRKENEIKRRKEKAKREYEKQKRRDAKEQARYEKMRQQAGMGGMPGMPGGMGGKGGMGGIDPNLLAGIFANMKGGKGGMFAKGGAPTPNDGEQEREGPKIEEMD